MKKITLIVSYLAIIILVAVAGFLIFTDNNSVKEHEVAYAKNQKELAEYEELSTAAIKEREEENARIEKVNKVRLEYLEIQKKYFDTEPEEEAVTEESGSKEGTAGTETTAGGEAPAGGESTTGGETPVGGENTTEGGTPAGGENTTGGETSVGGEAPAQSDATPQTN